MEQKKARKAGIMDILRSPYAHRFFKKYKWSYLLGMAILIVIDSAQTEVPRIVGQVIDGIKYTTIDESGFASAIIRMAVIAVLVLAGRIGWRYCIFGAARKIERDMRNDLFSHLNTLPVSYFHEHNAGEIMAYMTNDIEAVRMTFAATIMMGLDMITIGVTTLLKMIFQIDFRLSLVTVIPLSMVAFVSMFVGREMHKRFTKRQEVFAKVSDFVQEKLSGIKVIKAFVQEEKEIAAFEAVNSESRTANIRDAKVQAFMFPFMHMIAGCSMAIAIAYGGYIAILGRITVGDFSAFVQYLNMLVWPIASIGRIINVVTRGSASLKRVESVLHTESDIKDALPEIATTEPVKGEIEARELTFRYPGTDRDVLKDISFHIEPGQTLGIVGRTGAGKTTLVSLMLRIIDPDDDMLYIGGREIHTIPLQTLRASTGYVMQDNFLFSDTIRNNIAFGDHTKSFEEIQQAAKMACVHDNIVDFPDGYETMVGERGVSLSGGQKQRISIARALILDPEILILDDALSAVDTDTEEKILENLKTLRHGKTNVIIAHRISTLQNADKIIVIDGSRIIEEGNHEELVAQGEMYADLYRRQLLEKMKKEEYKL